MEDSQFCKGGRIWQVLSLRFLVIFACLCLWFLCKNITSMQNSICLETRDWAGSLLSFNKRLSEGRCWSTTGYIPSWDTCIAYQNVVWKPGDSASDPASCNMFWEQATLKQVRCLCSACGSLTGSFLAWLSPGCCWHFGGKQANEKNSVSLFAILPSLKNYGFSCSLKSFFLESDAMVCKEDH